MAFFLGKKHESWLPDLWRRLKCSINFLPVITGRAPAHNTSEDKGRDSENGELTIVEDQV